MRTRKRDYRAEYARRIERALARGLSRSQARGHPRPKEALASQPRAAPTYSRQLEVGFKLISQGRSLSGAAKDIGVSPERLRRYLQGQGVAERRGRKWAALPDRRTRRMLIFSEGEARSVEVRPHEASEIGSYDRAVREFLSSNDPLWLAAYERRSVIDVRGRSHPFETDPNALYRLALSGSDAFEQIYRIVV